MGKGQEAAQRRPTWIHPRGWESFVPSPPLMEQSFCLREEKFISRPLWHSYAMHHTHPTEAAVWPQPGFSRAWWAAEASLESSPLDSGGFMWVVWKEGA